MTRLLASYLFAFLYWWGIALGCLMLLTIHHLTGGRWGLLMRPILEAASRTIPVLALLFLPVCFGVGLLYPWAQPGAASLHQMGYLNPIFFWGRAVLYFAVWIGLAWRLTRAVPTRAYRLSAVGLILCAFTVTFAAVDWIMSLDEPRWASSIYGLLIGVGQLLAGFAFAVLVFCRLSRSEPIRRVPDLAGRFNDMGNLLLTAVMTWAYLAFMQFLIIWMGNLPGENVWVLRRTAGAWVAIAIGLIALQFALPNWLLLFRGFKRRALTLGGLALWLLVTHLFEVYWLVLPAFFPNGPSPSAWDLVLPVLLGAVWLATFGWHVRRRPLLIPEAQEVASHG